MLNLASDLLIYLLFTLVVALVGGSGTGAGRRRGRVAAPQLLLHPAGRRFTIAEPNNLVALIAFVTAAVAVSAVVDLAARRAGQAARASGEAQLLATLAGTALQAEQALPALLDQVREAFGLTAVTLLETPARPDRWLARSPRAGGPCRHRTTATTSSRPGTTCCGRRRRPSLTAQTCRLWQPSRRSRTVREQQRLAEQAAAARPAVEADRMRRRCSPPSATTCAPRWPPPRPAVTALRSPGVAPWTDDDRRRTSSTRRTPALDRLTGLVTDLLDLSRLQAGALARSSGDASPSRSWSRASWTGSASRARAVTLAVPDDLPEVITDPILLERALANLVANAAALRSARTPATITGSLLDTTDPPPQVELRVIDHGPGIPAEDRERAFVPFQRLGDHDNTAGVGLGLAVARGLTEALGGTLEAEETPGGGLTMVLRLPAASGRPAPAPRPPHRALTPDPTQVPQVPPKASS